MKVNAKCVESILRGGGIGMCCVVPLFDAASKVAELPENEESGYPDCYVFPGQSINSFFVPKKEALKVVCSQGKDTFHLCPWAAAGKAIVAEILCSFHWKSSLQYQVCKN